MPHSAGGAATIGQCVLPAARLYWRRLPLLILANVVWLLLSLLVITWPAATAGLFTLVRRVVEEELDGAPHEARIADFWEGFRQDGVRATLVTLLGAAGLAIIAVALLFYARAPAEPLRWLVGPLGLIGLVWVGGMLYLFPLLLRWPERGPWHIVRQALLIAVATPLLTLPLLLTTLVLTVAAVALAGPILLVYFSAMAMLQTVAFRQLLIQWGEVREGDL